MQRNLPEVGPIPTQQLGILVVDDDPAVRHWTALALETAGHRVWEASCADEAIELIEQIASELRILLTDIRMPGTDGFGLAQWVRTRLPAVQVIYMSGFAEQPAEPGARMLQKPFTFQALKAAVGC